MKALGTLFTLLFVAVATHAGDPCFEGKLPFFQNFESLQSENSSKAEMMTNACRELKRSEYFDSRSVAESLASEITKGNSNGFGLMPLVASFDKMDGSERQKKFKSELEKIKKIESPMERIKLTYELVAQNQGRQDLRAANSLRFGTPSNLLNRVDSDGSVGVCRDTAALLQWSLLQVARHADSKSSQIGPNDFVPKVLFGELPANKNWQASYGHAWVRVELPQFKNGKQTGFNVLDLDTTNYPQQFSPLMPRRSGLSEANREKALKQCDEINSCLNKRDLAKPLTASLWQNTTQTTEQRSAAPSPNSKATRSQSSGSK